MTGRRRERLVCLVVGIALGTHFAAWPRSPIVQLAFLAELGLAVLLLALPTRRQRASRDMLKALTAPPPDRRRP